MVDSVGDCYICLEECDHKSPCNCGHPVHEKCLKDARKYKNMCTICHDKFSDTSSEGSEESEPACTPCKPCVWCCLSPLIYFLSGVLGQMFIGLVGLPFGYRPVLFGVVTFGDVLSVLASFNFFISAVLVHLPFMLYGTFKSRTITTVSG